VEPVAVEAAGGGDAVAAGGDAVLAGGVQDVVDGVEAGIADAGLGVDGDEAAGRAAVEGVAEVQVAVEENDRGLRSRAASRSGLWPVAKWRRRFARR